MKRENLFDTLKFLVLIHLYFSYHIRDSENTPNWANMFCIDPPGTYSRMINRNFSD